jgi:hypothetical protein
MLECRAVVGRFPDQLGAVLPAVLLPGNLGSRILERLLCQLLETLR